LKARTVVTKVLLVALPLLVMFSCKHQENSPAAAPQTKGPAAATVATAKAVSAVPKVIASQGSIKISGSQSGSVKVPAKQGGYLVKFRYKGYGLVLISNKPALSRSSMTAVPRRTRGSSR